MSTHVSKHTRIQILTHMSTHMPVLLVQTQSACTSMSAQAYLSRAPARTHACTSSTGVLRHKQCVLLCSQSIQLRAHCHRMPRPHARTHARTRTRAHVRTHARWQELCYTLIQCGPLPSLSRCGHVCRHLHGHVRAASCILQVPSAWRTSILLHACCMSHATCRMSAYHIAATDSHVTCCMSCVVPLRRVYRPHRPWRHFRWPHYAWRHPRRPHRPWPWQHPYPVPMMATSSSVSADGACR